MQQISQMICEAWIVLQKAYEAMDSKSEVQIFDQRLVKIYNSDGVEILLPKGLVNLWVVQNPNENTEPSVDKIVQESVIKAIESEAKAQE